MSVSGTPTPWIESIDAGVRLHVLVSPKASRTRVVGTHDERLKVQVAAPPTDNKANDALVKFVAKALDVPRAQVDVVSGANGRRKTVQVMNVSVAHAVTALAP